jgi:TetR/AcrR family transcriptional regulator
MKAKREIEKATGRMTGENRRQQILEVAIRLFSEKGFRGTTTKEIALSAGVNEAIIFRHFATKSDLYSAILDFKACSAASQAFEESVEAAMAREDDRAVFESIARHILDNHKRDDAFMRLLLYSALERHELAVMFHERLIKDHYRRLAGYIRRRSAAGAFRRVDPMTAVGVFIGMVVHHAQMANLYGDDLLYISNRTAAERFADIFFRGVLAKEDGLTARPRRHRS